MEESITSVGDQISLLDLLKQEFDCKEVDIRGYSPLTLAYIGDCFYDVIIRTVAVARGNTSTAKLHQRVSRLVNAGTQAQLIESILDLLTDEEISVYRRGRNAKSHTTAKNASVIDYRKATGMEALLGYLYLKGESQRAVCLVKAGLQRLEKPL